MWIWFQKGGVIMYLMPFCSIAALAIFLERLWQIHYARINTVKFMSCWQWSFPFIFIVIVGFLC